MVGNNIVARANRAGRIVHVYWDFRVFVIFWLINQKGYSVHPSVIILKNNKKINLAQVSIRITRDRPILFEEMLVSIGIFQYLSRSRVKN